MPKTFLPYWCSTVFLILKGLFSFGQACYNEGFELSAPGSYTNSNSVAGWTISCAPTQSSTGACSPSSADTWTQAITEFSIRQTPLFGVPNIGTISNSPFGGVKIAQLNDQNANGIKTRLQTTFSVTGFNSVFGLALCSSLDGNGHSCCGQPYAKVNLYNCAGVLQSCFSFSFVPPGPSCTNATSSFSSSSGVYWSNWFKRQIDLTQFINSCVTIEIIASDCIAGDHHGSLFVDATCMVPQLPPSGLTPVSCFPVPVNYCPGASIAQIVAPPGYATYSWSAPGFLPPIPASQASLSILTVTSPVMGATYTVTLTNGPCIFIATYPLIYSSVSVAATATMGSCLGGSNGSATVFGTGSGSGYTYIWTNSSNSVISTSSVAANLAPGNYSVTIGALGSPGCGSWNASVTIGTKTATEITDVKIPYCGSVAVVSFTGTNFKWYQNGILTTSMTASSYSFTNPVPNSTIGVSFDSPQNCRDSLRLMFMPVIPSTISIVANPFMCSSANNGSVQISLLTNTLNPLLYFGLNVSSTGTTFPFSFSNTNTVGWTQSVFSLTPGQYSVIATDGICTYSTSFTKPSVNFDFTISPVGHLCYNMCQNAIVTLTSNVTNSSFNFSWSPNTFINGSGPGRQICNLLAPGTQSTIQYTVIATSSLNCSQSKTISVTMSNPSDGTISALPSVCLNSGTLQALGSPVGGTFSSSGFISSNGIITPSLTIPGVKIVTYSTSLGPCIKSVSTTIQILGPYFTVPASCYVCLGKSVTYSLSSAYQYTWSNGTYSNTATYNPSVTSVQNVTGVDVTTGCSYTQTFAINVIPSPTLNVVYNSSVCKNSMVVLTAFGANSYSWNAIAGTNTFTFIPTGVDTIVVDGELNGCIDQRMVPLNVSECAGIEDIRVSEIMVYPNPFQNSVVFKTNKIIDLEIFDSTGKLVVSKQKIPGDIEIDLRNIPTGVYIAVYHFENTVSKCILVRSDQ